MDRGGSWINHAGFCRSAVRPYASPDFRFYGLRLASVLVDE